MRRLRLTGHMPPGCSVLQPSAALTSSTSKSVDVMFADAKPVHADVPGLDLLPYACTRWGVRTRTAELFSLCCLCALRRSAQLLCHACELHAWC